MAKHFRYRSGLKSAESKMYKSNLITVITEYFLYLYGIKSVFVTEILLTGTFCIGTYLQFTVFNLYLYKIKSVFD